MPVSTANSTPIPTLVHPVTDFAVVQEPPPDLCWPLMHNNIPRADLDAAIVFLQQDAPRLTHGEQTARFEAEWSEWLGVRHSVFVNSGSSANLLSLAALRELRGAGEVIVPTLTWISDVASVLRCGFTPVFVDINPQTLGMDTEEVLSKLSESTRAVFLTHVLGFNALSSRLLDALAERGIPLLEDVCESHGATYRNRKLGTFGWMSNFSFYYAHHMSTIEGGMISTDDPDLYALLRMLRSHGLTREVDEPERRQHYAGQHPDLNPDFIFAVCGFNMRPTEIHAVIGRAQLRRLDANNALRRRNLDLFLGLLNQEKYFTDFHREGSCNYALPLILRDPDPELGERVTQTLLRHGVEHRRGLSGGGNQLRQPYLRNLVPAGVWHDYPEVEHVHFYGFYIGNYPDLEPEKIQTLCTLLNAL